MCDWNENDEKSVWNEYIETYIGQDNELIFKRYVWNMAVIIVKIY